MNENRDLEEFLKQNERRVYYQIHQLQIDDKDKEYFQEGLVAMWKAYENYQPDKGPLSTYMNYTIRNRLIDAIRKGGKEKELLEKFKKQYQVDTTSGNYRNPTGVSHILIDNEAEVRSEMDINREFWKVIRSLLTEKEWKWVRYYVIEGMSQQEIANQEKVTLVAVKGWAREVRKKLRSAGWENLKKF
ncbi:hypothetical protein AQ616_07690 [Oceanobacillus sp. E9]|uniref:RNA polymerase sigma-70 region 2 domain-containing protein n=1 Tax=Oceanobacillus kimchii TaxID=746691 RepID=A0ABQ5TKQ0_9BACI|nr:MULTISPECIES: sigma-70 family RNA polymerase sigma factor [Oceanobacillus]OEH54920.1 hypothetical protein AQ616_07690 [Oceanobacillus sp. E9]GLO67428.1 hypothetical protein MACH08_32120 [Oceanobacillus kimchii]